MPTVQTQADVDARQAKEDAIYAKRTARALEISNRAAAGYASWRLGADTRYFTQEAARHGRDPFYRAALYRQAAQFGI